jgi:hypothetical protein
MKKIILSSIIISALTSCGWSEKENELQSKIVKYCLISLNVIKPSKLPDTLEEIQCNKLTLKLKKDDRFKAGTGCTTSNHLCHEIRYNYELTFDGKNFPNRIPYYLVLNSLEEVRDSNKKDKEIDNSTFFKK